MTALLTAAADPTSDSYDLAMLDRVLSMTPFSGKLHHFAEIGSTNIHALQQAEAGALHGSVYLADAQTAGRGRGGHTWSSPPGSGLYVSVLLRPALAPGDALWLSLAAGLAVHAALLQATGLEADLRWPNDLLIGRRKVAGILTEMHAEVTRVRYLVIGIGINVHQPAFPPELASTATSLAIEGVQTTRGALLAALLGALHQEVVSLTGNIRESRQSILARVEAASTWMRNKAVIVEEGQAAEGTSFRGVTAGLDDRGFLQVRTADGVRSVLSGGVREA